VMQSLQRLENERDLVDQFPPRGLTLGGGNVARTSEDGNIQEMKLALLEISSKQEFLVSTLLQLTKTVSELSKGVMVPPHAQRGSDKLASDASPSDWANHQANSNFVSSTAAGSSLRAKPGLSVSLEAEKTLVGDIDNE